MRHGCWRGMDAHVFDDYSTTNISTPPPSSNLTILTLHLLADCVWAGAAQCAQHPTRTDSRRCLQWRPRVHNVTAAHAVPLPVPVCILKSVGTVASHGTWKPLDRGPPIKAFHPFAPMPSSSPSQSSEFFQVGLQYHANFRFSAITMQVNG